MSSELVRPISISLRTASAVMLNSPDRVIASNSSSAVASSMAAIPLRPTLNAALVSPDSTREMATGATVRVGPSADSAFTIDSKAPSSSSASTESTPNSSLSWIKSDSASALIFS